MPNTNSPRIAYIVQKIGWTFNDQWYYRDGMEDDEPIRAYATRERAEAERLRMEREAWKEVGSPLDYGSRVEAVSSLTEAQFIEFLEANNLFPARLRERRYLDWRDWWELIEDDLTAEQRELLWRVMDRLHLFEVVEVEVESEAHP